MARPRLIALAIACVPMSVPAAQGQSDPPIDTRTVLQKSFQKMAWLQGLEISTTEEQDSSISRQIGRGLGGNDVEVSGLWTPDTVQLEVGDEDEVVYHRGRLIARDDDHDWVLRRDRLAGGGDLPFLFDPALFFDVLARIPAGALDIARDVTEGEDDAERRVITLTLDGESARELVNAGALPRVEGGNGAIFRIAGRLGGHMPEADLQTDVALWIDPVSHLVHRIRVKSYQEAGFGGQVVVQVQRGGIVLREEEEDEEEAPEPDHAESRFKKGLPVRQSDENESSMTFEVTLSKHDMPMLPDLDDKARRLLRLR